MVQESASWSIEIPPELEAISCKTVTRFRGKFPDNSVHMTFSRWYTNRSPAVCTHVHIHARTRGRVMLACRLVSLSRAHLCSRSSVYAASQQRSGQQVSYLWQIFSRLESPSLSSSKSVDKIPHNEASAVWNTANNERENGPSLILQSSRLGWISSYHSTRGGATLTPLISVLVAIGSRLCRRDRAQFGGHVVVATLFVFVSVVLLFPTAQIDLADGRMPSIACCRLLICVCCVVCCCSCLVTP